MQKHEYPDAAPLYYPLSFWSASGAPDWLTHQQAMGQATELLWSLQADLLLHPWRRMESGYGGWMEDTAHTDHYWL